MHVLIVDGGGYSPLGKVTVTMAPAGSRAVTDANLAGSSPVLGQRI